MKEPVRQTASAPSQKLRALHIFSLFGFAVAQPMFSLLQESPDFLVAHHAQGLEIFSLIFLLSLALPSAFALGAWAFGFLRPSLGDRMHDLQVAGLSTLFGLQFFKDTDALSGAFLLALMVALGVAFAFAYRRLEALRLLLTYLTPTILLFPILFLLHPRIYPLAFPPSFEQAAQKGDLGGPPVILLVFDELPLVSLLDGSRQIGVDRYPNFAALAKESHWFRNATTVADNTHYAIPAIVTGNVPKEAKRSMTFADYPQNIFTLLANRMDFQVFETISQFCPQEVCSQQTMREEPHQRLKNLFTDLSVVYLHLVAPQSFARRLPDVTSTWRDFLTNAPLESDALSQSHVDGGDIPRLFANFLNSFERNSLNTFHYLHINVPHIPWKYLPSGLEYGPLGASVKPRPMRGIRWIDDDWRVLQEQQRHLLQVIYADRLLGELLERLDEVGLRDEVLLIVTSDHGASFNPGEFRRKLDDATYHDILPVPLLIKEPGQRTGSVNDRNAETIDILPTVAGLLDVEIPWAIDGQDLFDTSKEDRAKKFARRPGLGDEQGFVYEGNLEKKYESAEQLLKNFGVSVDSLFDIGPRREILGIPLEDFDYRAGAANTVELLQPWLLAEVNRKSGFIPARLQGTLRMEPPVEEAAEIAIAINGKIQAVTETFQDRNEGPWEFSSMVPESSLLEGANDVQIFLVEEEQGSLHLRPLPLSSNEYFELLTVDGQLMIKPAHGEVIRVQEGAFEGAYRNTRMVFEGWAENHRNKSRRRAVDRILVFAGEKFLFSTTALRKVTFNPPFTSEKEHLAQGPRRGFVVMAPFTALDESARDQIKVFAVQGQLASQLEGQSR